MADYDKRQKMTDERSKSGDVWFHRNRRINRY